MLMTEDQLRGVSPKAWQRKRNVAIIVTVFWLMLILLTVHAWVNLTVEYYGQAVALRDLVAHTSAIYCAPKREPQWYRDLSAHFPLIPRPICFDTQQEMMVYANIPFTPTLTFTPTITPPPTPGLTPRP